MIGNPERERKLLEQTYEDRMTVLRSAEWTECSVTKTGFKPMYQNIPCALSFGGSDKSRQTNSVNQMEYDAVVFAPPDPVIQQGDKLEIFCCGRIFSLEAVGKMTICPTHQEIRARERGSA